MYKCIACGHDWVYHAAYVLHSNLGECAHKDCSCLYFCNDNFEYVKEVHRQQTIRKAYE